MCLSKAVNSVSPKMLDPNRNKAPNITVSENLVDIADHDPALSLTNGNIAPAQLLLTTYFTFTPAFYYPHQNVAALHL